MDRAEKMHCRANGEVIFLCQEPFDGLKVLKPTNPIDQRRGLTGGRKEVDYPIIQAKQQRILLTGMKEK
jgi:hypothetical protein